MTRHHLLFASLDHNVLLSLTSEITQSMGFLRSCAEKQ